METVLYFSCAVYLFNFLDWDPTVNQMQAKEVNWLESASFDMHDYVSWCLRISMRLYFAILGVGKRSLWCAGFTDPPKPSGWYRKYIETEQ